MFKFLFGGTSSDAKPTSLNRNGIERIKLTRNLPCHLILVEQALNTTHLELNTAYVRMEDKLLYINKKESHSLNLELDPAQIKQFDLEFKPTSSTRKLTPDELKKITQLTGHTPDQIYIELIYSGYYVDANKTAAFKKLIENTQYNFVFHEIPAKPGWGFYSVAPDTTVEIMIPVSDIEKKREAFQDIKQFIEQWEPQWLPVLENMEKEILLNKAPFQLTKDKNNIPILSITQHIDKILITFLYTGKGMDEERTKKLTALAQSLSYSYEKYELTDMSTALQLSIPLEEIVSETKNYKNLKKFILQHDESMLTSLLIYEKNLKKERAFLSASHVF